MNEIEYHFFYIHFSSIFSFDIQLKGNISFYFIEYSGFFHYSQYPWFGKYKLKLYLLLNWNYNLSREPLSLAKMGQRITAKSTVDISYEKMTPVLPIPSSGPASFDSVSLLSSKLLTSPATPSRIPMRRASMTVRKTNSISSTGNKQ